MLQSAGITTFDELAAADVSRIREILDQEGLRLADPSSWGEQARLAAAGDQAGLKALQDRLNAGRQV
jgi:predicted flap endonuclease-1-like 5' DNA nuclease